MVNGPITWHGSLDHQGAVAFHSCRESKMADYPCDGHNARYAGPSNRAYVNVFREDQVVRLKAALCPLCLDTLLSDWLEKCLHQVQAGGWDPPTEGQLLEGLWMSAGNDSGPLRSRQGR